MPKSLLSLTLLLLTILLLIVGIAAAINGWVVVTVITFLLTGLLGGFTLTLLAVENMK